MAEQDHTSSFSYASSGGRELLVFWPGGGVRVPLTEGASLTVGRAESCEIRIEHRSVSREHARVSVTREGVAVEDLGSANGTRVGGQPIAPGVAAALVSGSVVETGGATLLLCGIPNGPSPVALPTRTGNGGPGLDRMVALLADSSIPVVFVGETGAGKEVWARRLHDQSKRARRPWVPINCAAIPESLIESELFGHAKGAFTGAASDRVGRIEYAEDGTVFLDELGDLPLAAQAKLLRVVETCMVLPLGATKPRPVRARFVAATNKDLAEEVERGRFRADLYYRLNGMTLRVAPLRERREEIPALAQTLAEKACESLGKTASFSSPAMTWLTSQPWPGNVRELKHRIECACLFSTSERIELEDLLGEQAPAPCRPPDRAVEGGAGLWDERAELERQRIMTALDECGGNQTRAAKLLMISRRTLINRLEAYGASRPRKKAT